MHATQKQHVEMPLRVHARFLEADLFARTYCRNNPKKGVKHLRCFPHCSLLGHREASFCGRPVNVEITLRAEEDDGHAIDMHDLLYIGEFVPAWALHEQPRLQVSEQWIQDNLRTTTNPKGGLYKGVIYDSQFPHLGAGEEKKCLEGEGARLGLATGTTAGAGLASTAGAAASTTKAASNTAPEEPRHLSFVVRFNDNDTSAWQCGIRTSANVLYAFCVRVLRFAPEIIGDAEDTYEEVFRALSPPFFITSARRLSGAKASAKLSRSESTDKST